MSLVHRTIKLTFAMLIAIWLAEALGLSYTTSAGVIAILSVLETRRSSFVMAKKRLLAALLALALAVVCFQLLGYHLWVIGCYLLLYVPLSYYFKLEVGIAPVTVLVLHLFVEKRTDLVWLGNELSLFIIGAGVALLLTLYMPSKEAEIAAYHEKVETLLKRILLRFNDFLLQGDGTNEALLITQLDQALSEALTLAYIERQNQVFSPTDEQVSYFQMRQEQAKLLRQMAIAVNSCALDSKESIILAHLFYETAQQLSQMNSAKTLQADIKAFREMFRQRDLPQTRSEFETRAILFQLLNDMERFIQLKVDFYEVYYEK